MLLFRILLYKYIFLYDFSTTCGGGPCARPNGRFDRYIERLIALSERTDGHKAAPESG